MGANEKHAATYHGGEYTPSELALITAWADQRRNLLEYAGEPFEGVVERTAQAQRTIAKIRAEAKAEALREAAHDLFDWVKSPFMCLDECGNSDCPDDIRLGAGKDIQKWLRARANQYKENQS